MFQVSVDEVVANDDVSLAFYSTHATNLTSWLVEERQIDYEAEIPVPDNGRVGPILDNGLHF